MTASEPSDAEKACHALGWNPGRRPSGVSDEDCVFLFADGTLSPGQGRRERLKTVLPIVSREPIDADEKVVTEAEHAVAWRLNEKRQF